MQTEKSRKENSRKKRKGSGVVTFLLVLVMLAGLGIMAYPTFADWYNSLHESRAITTYNQIVSENDDEENERLWQEAIDYNERLAERLLAVGGGPVLTLTDEEMAEYEAALSITDSGIMGYIDVPEQNIHLPIYHGTSETVLQTAIGHLEGTSLPVGGTSSHIVVSGHTGLPSARLFTDIDQMEIGDTFTLTVLDHVLTYEVDDIRTVLPTELDSLAIEEGRDLCTLLTCTPYGINTHRLLVTGHRIPTPETEDADEKPSDNWRRDSLQIGFKLMLPFIFGGIVIVILIYLAVTRSRKKKRKAAKNARKRGMK